eukprot:358848-Chlamydomonas_euryale.AAC.2
MANQQQIPQLAADTTGVANTSTMRMQPLIHTSTRRLCRSRTSTQAQPSTCTPPVLIHTSHIHTLTHSSCSSCASAAL